jgi:hypothetical protein
LGTDFDATEQRIVPALMWLKRGAAGWPSRLALATSIAMTTPSDGDAPVFERLGLGAPQGLRDRLLRRLVAAGLAGSRA